MTTGENPQPTAAVNVVRDWGDGELLVPERDDVLPWDLAIQHLAGAQLFWHVTHRPDTNAHVRPVFGVECDGVLCSTTSAGARKTRLLERDPRCSLAATTDGMDLVYEGIARRVREPDQLGRIAEAYRAKYAWPVTVTPDGAFEAPFGAPAAGPPPYHVYAFDPLTVWGFGTDDRYAARSTRWDFDRWSSGRPGRRAGSRSPQRWSASRVARTGDEFSVGRWSVSGDAVVGTEAATRR